MWAFDDLCSTKLIILVNKNYLKCQYFFTISYKIDEGN